MASYYTEGTIMKDVIEDVGSVIMLLALIAQMATPFALVGLAIWLML